MESAEQAAVSAPRDTESSPKYYASHRLNLFTKDNKIAPGAREMILTPNRHFDHLAVNVSLSAVLLPPGVKDTGTYICYSIIPADYENVNQVQIIVEGTRSNDAWYTYLPTYVQLVQIVAISYQLFLYENYSVLE